MKDPLNSAILSVIAGKESSEDEDVLNEEPENIEEAPRMIPLVERVPEIASALERGDFTSLSKIVSSSREVKGEAGREINAFTKAATALEKKLKIEIQKMKIKS